MLSEIKLVLGIKEEALDELLSILIDQSRSRLKILLGAEEVPEDLEYIINEVVIKRYNKIGSEGTSSHSIDGESLTYESNDFASYLDEIQAWRNAQKGQKIGRIRFL